MPSLSASLILSLTLTAPLSPVQKHAGSSSDTAPAVKESPAVTALALKIYQQMRAGNVDQSLLTPTMNKALSPDILSQNKPMFDQLGDPTKLTFESGQRLVGGTQFVYLAAFATAQLHVQIFVDNDGKIGGYRLAP